MNANGLPTQPGNLVRRLDANGDFTFGQGLANYAVDSEAVAQIVYTRLRLFLGEWFLDTSAGVPYFQEILVDPANVPLAESLLKASMLNTPGVATMEAFDLFYDPHKRILTVTATLVTIYGDTLNIVSRQS